MLQIYHGNAKGKTSAVVGATIRASAQGYKVFFTQFLKDFTSGEIKILRSIQNVIICDEYKVENFIFNMNDTEKLKTKQQMNELFDIVCQKVEQSKSGETKIMVVFDEILDLINLGWLDEDKFIKFCTSNSKNVEILITGRNPSENIKQKAHYISELVCQKHPFDDGAVARKGIEF